MQNLHFHSNKKEQKSWFRVLAGTQTTLPTMPHTYAGSFSEYKIKGSNLNIEIDNICGCFNDDVTEILNI